MDAIRGVILDRTGDKQSNESGMHKYLIGLVLVTDSPLGNLAPNGETILMGGWRSSELTELIDELPSYVPPTTLGAIDLALLHVSNMPEEHISLLERVKNT